MMPKNELHRTIKSFAQNLLGCSCPEEVFDSIITCKDNSINLPQLSLQKIIIGNRLLIYLVNIPRQDNNIEKIIDNITSEGKEQRDNNGLNRFRLVLLTDREEISGQHVAFYFNGLKQTDDRTHLHIFNRSEIDQQILTIAP